VRAVGLVGHGHPFLGVAGTVGGHEERPDLVEVDVHAGPLQILEFGSVERSLTFSAVRPWAVGGFEGAQYLVRASEPADVLIWVNDDDLLAWQEMLLAQQVPRGRALLRVAVAPDAWALGLNWIDQGISVADPAQLYLDCYSEGERALKGAAAIRGKLG
jgi:hypothetical protein